MKLLVLILNNADTAVLLRAKLGPLRSWPDFLSDNIRGRQSLNGYRLLPCCRKKGRTGFRPHYSLPDIDNFVKFVKAVNKSAGSTPMKASAVMLETTLGWRHNKFDHHCVPIVRPVTMAYVGALNG